MSNVTIDTLLWFIGMAGELIVLALLLRKNGFKSFPMLCIYLLWAFLSDGALYLIGRLMPNSYRSLFLINFPIDSLLQLGVLVELAWSVLRPIRKSLPKGTIYAISGIVVLAGAIIWPFAGHLATHLDLFTSTFIHTQQTFGVLRILFFLVLAAFSQLLAINWRDRELQIATGLGFYSLVSLAAATLEAHQLVGAQYHWLDYLRTGSFLLAMAYWAVSFSRKEPERKEFSPQMEKFLLQMAGVSRNTRVVLAGPQVPERSAVADAADSNRNRKR